MITIYTKAGGQIDFEVSRSAVRGTFLYLHIDQSTNMNNGEGDAAILLTVSECKEIIGNINEFIKLIEGDHYVVTKQSVLDLISKPEVQQSLIELGLEDDFKNL